MLSAGDKAPLFTLPNQDGAPVSIADYIGKQYVVVYFYPKAMTAGCTKQACNIRDMKADFNAAGAVVLGLSPDPVADLDEFRSKHKLNFDLLADPDGAVATKFGVWGQRRFLTKTYMGVSRSSFVIDKDGKVALVVKRANPLRDADRLLKFIRGRGA